MVFESVIEFDKWTMGFKRQQQFIRDGGNRSSMIESGNMMLNESMSMAQKNAGPIKVLDDDLRSLAPQAPKPKISKFPTSFASDKDIQDAKKRLSDL